MAEILNFEAFKEKKNSIESTREEYIALLRGDSNGKDIALALEEMSEKLGKLMKSMGNLKERTDFFVSVAKKVSDASVIESLILDVINISWKGYLPADEEREIVEALIGTRTELEY